jgi:YHS domain-containing protein
MKWKIKIVALVFIVVSSCQQQGKLKETDSAGGNTGDTGVAKPVLATNRDLACGMSVTADVTDTAHYKGKVYGFCSPDCKKGFQSDPETYLAQ